MRASKCPSPVFGKALMNAKTNDLLPLPCGRWTCPCCGPAKSWRLGSLAAATGPERWITLTRVSEDVRGAYKRLTELSRLLRRRGYTWEYLAVPERHKNGTYHLHLLQKGSYIPQRVLSQLAERAGMGRWVWIKAIPQEDPQNAQKVAKYLVKYMTKDPEKLPPGVNRYSQSRGFWGMGGKTAFEARAFSSGGDWGVVHLGSREIVGDDGTNLWFGSKGSDPSRP